MDILDAGTVVISKSDFIIFVSSKIHLSCILSAVSGFTHAGIPFIRTTNSNPSLHSMFSGEIPSFICFIGDSVSAFMGKINENIKKNVIPRIIFLLITTITIILFFILNYH